MDGKPVTRVLKAWAVAMLAFIVILVVAVAVLLLAATPARAQTPVPPRTAEKFKHEVVRNARLEFGLDAPVALLAGQVEQESAWDETARSRVGALGLAQFMPMTAADLAKKIGGPAAPLNPAWALRAQARYMRELVGLVGYEYECDAFGAALSAYNGGLSRHNRRRLMADDHGDFFGSVRTINPGIAPHNQKENEDYPVRIIYQRQPRYATWGRTVCL